MRKIIKILFVFIVCLVLSILMRVKVYADEEPPTTATEVEIEISEEENERSGSGSNFDNGFKSKDAFGIGGEFDNLGGDGKYLSSNYRNNYSLDIVENLNYSSNLFNSMAGMLFSIVKNVGFLTCSAVYHALNFNLTELLAEELSYIQKSMVEGIFNPLWQLSFIAVGIVAIKKILKRNLRGVFEDIARVVMIIILSVVVSNYSVELLTFSGNVTKSISATIFTALEDSVGIHEDDSYAVVVTANIWNNLVHIPWKTFEFGVDNYTEEDVIKILYTEPDSKARKKVVKEYNKIEGNKAFVKGRGAGRIGDIIIYLIPFFIKCVLFILLAILNIVLQFLAIVVMILAVVVLFMCLMPFFGFKVINTWLEKFMEVHLSMFIVSLFTALVLWIDRVMFRYIGEMGWLVVIVIQSIICVVLFLCRDKIMQIFLRPKRSLETELFKFTESTERLLHELGGKNLQGKSKTDKVSRVVEPVQDINVMEKDNVKMEVDSATGTDTSNGKAVETNTISIEDEKTNKLEIDVEKLEESDVQKLTNVLKDVAEKQETKKVVESNNEKHTEKNLESNKTEEKELLENQREIKDIDGNKIELEIIKQSSFKKFVNELKNSIEKTKDKSDKKDKKQAEGKELEKKELEEKNIKLPDVKRKTIDYD